MDPEAPMIGAEVRVAELAERIARRDPAVSRHQALFITDAEGNLAGVITRGDVLRALERDASGVLTVLEAGSKDPTVTYPDELLAEALARMLHRDVGRLPVVERGNPRKVVGYLGRQGILAGRLRRLQEEYVREPRWFRALRRNSGKDGAAPTSTWRQRQR
jgi:chloride channel protein, CIC family